MSDTLPKESLKLRRGWGSDEGRCDTFETMRLVPLVLGVSLVAVGLALVVVLSAAVSTCEGRAGRVPSCQSGAGICPQNIVGCGAGSPLIGVVLAIIGGVLLWVGIRTKSANQVTAEVLARYHQ
jgi:hypothetical protein